MGLFLDRMRRKDDVQGGVSFEGHYLEATIALYLKNNVTAPYTDPYEWVLFALDIADAEGNVDKDQEAEFNEILDAYDAANDPESFVIALRDAREFDESSAAHGIVATDEEYTSFFERAKQKYPNRAPRASGSSGRGNRPTKAKK